MTPVETMRAALFGSPPAANYKPYRQGVLDAFTMLSDQATTAIVVTAEPYNAATTASAADNTTAINTAISDANAAGGGTVIVPAGTYNVNALTMLANVTLQGAGRSATILKSNHTGAGLKATFPINSSTAANTCVRDLTLWNTNASNTDGGYVDTGGTFVTLYHVRVIGFKRCVIFDQSELADIDLCEFKEFLLCGVWLVNNNEYTTGASAEFTNRISINRCQFNGGSTTIGIIDDGGTSHTFQDNNYNGCSKHIRVAGVTALNIIGGEFEGATAAPIKFDYRTYAGNSGPGQCLNVLIQGTTIVPSSGNCSIDANTSGPEELNLISNLFGNGGVACVKAAGVNRLFLAGNKNATAGPQPTYSGTPTSVTSDEASAGEGSATFTPVLKFGGGNTGLTTSLNYGKRTKFRDSVAVSIAITISAVGSSTGDLTIDTPIAPSGGMITQIVNVTIRNGVSMPSIVEGWLTPAGKIYAYNGSSNPSAFLTHANMQAGTEIYITGVYQV